MEDKENWECSKSGPPSRTPMILNIEPFLPIAPFIFELELEFDI